MGLGKEKQNKLAQSFQEDSELPKECYSQQKIGE